MSHSASDKTLTQDHTLIKAVLANDLPAVQNYIQQGYSLNTINETDNWGRTPLLWATYKGHPQIVQALLAIPQIAINTRDYMGRTALIWAAELGFVEIVNQLLAQSQIEINVISTWGTSALSVAVTQGHEEIVTALLAQPHIEVNAADHDGYLPLFSAIKFDRLPIIRALLASPHININARGVNGRTALITAARYKNLAAVQALLSMPAIEINRQDNVGHTALHWAAINEDIAIARALLSSPAVDINLAGADSATALIIAASAQNRAMVRLLLSQPHINVNSVGSWGRTALMSAIIFYNKDMVCDLLAMPGIDHQIKDATGNSALSLAIEKQKLELVEILLAAGYDINELNAGNTLIKACNATEGIAQIFVELPGLDLNKVDYRGNTPLLLAVKNKFYTLAQKLLEKSVDTTIINDKGEDAEQLAKTDAYFRKIFEKHIYKTRFANFLKARDQRFASAFSSAKDKGQIQEEVVSFSLQAISQQLEFFQNPCVSIKPQEAAELIFDFTNFIMSLGIHFNDDTKETLDKAMPPLFTLAAHLGNTAAQSIVTNFYNQQIPTCVPETTVSADTEALSAIHSLDEEEPAEEKNNDATMPLPVKKNSSLPWNMFAKKTNPTSTPATAYKSGNSCK